MQYVAGLLFNKDYTATVLVYKLRGPASVVGKWNAVGGKVDVVDDSIYAAMVREFKEETGVLVLGWTRFLTLSGGGWSVDFFYAASNEALAAVRTMEDEPIKPFYLNSLPPTVPNLEWILPMALEHAKHPDRVYDVNEREVI